MQCKLIPGIGVKRDGGKISVTSVGGMMSVSRVLFVFVLERKKTFLCFRLFYSVINLFFTCSFFCDY